MPKTNKGLITLKTSGLLKIALGIFARLVLVNVLSLMFSVSILTLFNSIFFRMICQLMNISILFFLPFGYCRSAGEKDRKLIKYGEIKEDVLKGLKAGVIATIPFLTVPVLLILEKLNVLQSQFLYIHRIVSAVFFPLNITLLPSTLTLTELGWPPVVLSCATVLVYPLVPAFAYIMGLRNIYLETLFRIKKSIKKRG